MQQRQGRKLRDRYGYLFKAEIMTMSFERDF